MTQLGSSSLTAGASRELHHSIRVWLPPLPAELCRRILLHQPEAFVLFTRRFKLIARILSLALLIGQMGAAAHAYSHLADDPQGLPETTQGCRTCHSFAPLLSTVGGPQSVLLVSPCVAESFVPADATPISFNPHYPAFRSRAPPELL